MEAREARLYSGDEIVATLCIEGYNDEFDEITIKDGKMVVKTMQTIDKGENNFPYRFVDEEIIYEDITKIDFK